MLSQHATPATTSSKFLRDISLRGYWNIAVHRKQWIILTATAVFVCAAVFAHRLPDIYRSETTILVDPQRVPDSYVAATVAGSIADWLATLRQHVMSPTRLKRVIELTGLYKDLRGPATEEEMVSRMQNATSIEVLAGGNPLSTFRIAFEDKNPVAAAQVANQLAAMFIEESLRVREQQFYGTAEFLDKELQQTKARLEGKEGELQRIKSQYILDLPESKQFHLESLTNLRTQLAASHDRMDRAQQGKVYLQSLAASSAPTVDLDSGGTGPEGSLLQLQTQKLESRLAELEARYGPSHPDVRKVKSQLEELKAKAAQEGANSPAATKPAIPVLRTTRNPVLEAELQRRDREIEEEEKLQAQLQPKIEFHLSKLERIPVFEEQIGSLMRDYDILRAHYNTLLEKKLSAEMASALESRQKGERFVVLDPATVPAKPFRPNRPLIILAGLFGGLLGGVGLTLVVEMTDGSIRSERQAAEILGAPILARIPCILTGQQRRRKALYALGAFAGTVACSFVLGVLLSYLGVRGPF